MPVIRISTNIEDTENRSLLAKAGADVFRSLGLRSEHITTVFIGISGRDLFIADTSFEDVYAEEKFLLATVDMGSHRGPETRSQLARAYTEAVSGFVAPHNVSVDFTARDPGDVYVGGVALGLASATTRTHRVPEGRRDDDLDDRLRQLLAAHWEIELTDWDPSTLLAELCHDEISWDSIEKNSLAITITSNLTLDQGLDLGQESVWRAFDDEATYADLLEVVRSCL